MNLFGPPNAQAVTDCTIGRSRSRALVAQLIQAWHSTLPNSPAGFRVAFIIYAPNQTPIAAAMWGRPIARQEDQTTTLELTRLAHSPDAPPNLGSWGLAQMRRWIRDNMPEIRRLISYHNADHHHGTIYRADNWRQVYDQHKKQIWTSRPGRKGTEVRHKVKWERTP